MSRNHSSRATVIQASFRNARPPAALVTHRYPSPNRPPHAATVQPRLRSGLRPHCATLGEPAVFHRDRAPHPATVQSKLAAARPFGPAPGAPASAPSAQRRAAEEQVHAFRVPAGLLDAAPRRGSQELPPVVRRKLETFFEADLSDVRVHVGPEAPAIGALAFTLGSDIYFAPGQYDPHSSQGQALLGHEVTHVLQQREGRVGNPFGDHTAVVQDPALEDEADHMGQLVAGTRPSGTSYRRELARLGTERVVAPPGPSGGGAQRRAGYQLTLGAYLHEDRTLPEPLAGHAFVAIQSPQGEPQAFGFSPARFSEYSPQRDLPRLAAGVEGVVHDDVSALSRPGVKLRTYTITEAQAKAALAKVEEYRAGNHAFSLDGTQCTAFAADVASAADIGDAASLRGRLPREVYRKL